MRNLTYLLAFATVTVAVSGCATNPVTGKTELVGLNEQQEISIGDENYAPMVQSQGGEYDVDPALTEYVSGVGQRLAAVSDRDLPYEFTVLNSSVPNAWALPGGKIAINRGLLTELDSEAELAAVLGHEIVHAAAGHTSQRQGRSTILQGVLLGAAIATSGTGFGDLAVGGASLGAQIINQQYGQGDELESDKYGMRYMSAAGYDPQGAVTLQQTFVRLSEGQNSDWLSGLFASHPPSQRRVDANKATAAKLPPGGETGADRFRAVMAKTKAAQPAFDLYDEGNKLLAEKKTDQAIAKANEAIALFPVEANFYALRGDAQYLAKNYDNAIASYDEAIRRRDDYFYYFLQRGRAYENLEQFVKAESDLEKSVAILPTGIGYFSLGNVARERGNIQQAIEHYEMVAGGQGDIATAARTELAKLDLEANPQKYVLMRCDADEGGNLVVSVKNNTGVIIENVGFVVEFRDANGRLNSEARKLGRPLGAGEIASVNTRLGPYRQGGNCPVRINSARIAR
jgi:predicted Zn-dependent protease